MSVQFEGVCMCICVWCGCTYSGEQIGEQFYLTFPLPSEVEVKQIFTVVTFYSHQIVHTKWLKVKVLLVHISLFQGILPLRLGFNLLLTIVLANMYLFHVENVHMLFANNLMLIPNDTKDRIFTACLVW